MNLSRSPRIAFTIALFALLPLAAEAEIFKCVGSEGHVTYSNVQSKNCIRLSLDPVPAAAPPAARPAQKTPTPSSFPRVDESTQKARDSDRRRILESEIATEQKSLEQAKKELAEQEAQVLANERIVGGAINLVKVQERVQPFKDKVALHERNIEAIRKEIANLR